MNLTQVKLDQDILCMWNAYTHVNAMLKDSANPEGQVNSAILDVIAKSPMQNVSSDIAAFGNYIKFMMHSHKDGTLKFPCESTFNSWYKQ
jgi:hypothetical protein